MSTPPAVLDHSRHTPYSDPGPWSHLLAAVPVGIEELSAVARNVIVHYRASGRELPGHSRDDINARWLAVALGLDQQRHHAPLALPRELTERVQGCCRDHTLFSVAVLRQHGIAARSRVGFAGYFVDGWHHDHVVVEAWLDGRWRRFDTEVQESDVLADPTDLEWATAGAPGFTSAAAVWREFRDGQIDPSRFGVDEHLPLLSGPAFLFDEVIHEVAHRFGDELLLWDCWGRMGDPGRELDPTDVAWLDEVAALLLRADAGDLDAERTLLMRYRGDDGLRPGRQVRQDSPHGGPPVTVQLRPVTPC